MKFYQYSISLNKPRGFHLITDLVVRASTHLNSISVGMMQVFIQHTSASLTINENADPTVRKDFETFFNKMVPSDFPEFTHTYEGLDDMPAHLKSSILSNSVQVPIKNGDLCLGTWQGIYFCEHRDFGGNRNLIITIWGN